MWSCIWIACCTSKTSMVQIPVVPTLRDSFYFFVFVDEIRRAVITEEVGKRRKAALVRGVIDDIIDFTEAEENDPRGVILQDIRNVCVPVGYDEMPAARDADEEMEEENDEDSDGDDARERTLLYYMKVCRNVCHFTSPCTSAISSSLATEQHFFIE